MTGYLKQIFRDNDPVGLYLFPVDLTELTITRSYQSWMDHPEFKGEFEDWWNEKHPDIQIERVFLEELYINERDRTSHL